MILFIAVIVLWITREPGVPGWSRFMPKRVDANGKVTECVKSTLTLDWRFPTIIYFNLPHLRYVGDTQPIVLMAFLALILPYNNPFKLRTRPEETRG